MFSPYLWILSIGHFTVDLCDGALPILVPVLAKKLDLSYFQIGLVVMAFAFSSAIIQPIFGMLSDRYRMPWLMPLGLFLSGLGLSLTGRAYSFGLLLLVVLISGIGVAGYHPEGSKLAHCVSADDKAGTSMAIFSVGGNLGFGVGPMIAVFVLSFSGLDSVYWIILPGVLVALVFLYLLPMFKAVLVENLPTMKKVSSQKILNNRSNKAGLTLLILYVTVRSWIQAGLVYFIPFYFLDQRSVFRSEYLVSIFLIAGVVGTMLGGPFADRFGGRNGLLVSMVVSLFAVYAFLHIEGIMSPVLAFIAGASLLSTISTTVVFGQRLLPQSIGLVSGLLLGFAVGMGSVGVTLLGAIADYAGLAITMNIIAFLPALGIILALTLPDIRTVKSVYETAKSLHQKS